MESLSHDDIVAESARMGVGGSASTNRKSFQVLNRLETRLRPYKEAVSLPTISMSEVRRLSFSGVPESFRALYWKILLGYLPVTRDDWPACVHNSRQLYDEYCNDLIIDPGRKEAADCPNDGKRHALSQSNDHPLNTAKESTWNSFFQDKEIQSEILKDVTRTYPDMHFFHEAPDVQNALKRILLLHAKLNPGVKYVQGMNEILAPLYYIFATAMPDSIITAHNNPEQKEDMQQAETDAFFCFLAIMADIRDFYCKSLDHDQVQGITGTLSKLMRHLKTFDPQLHHHLTELCINPQFFGFRWFSLLFSQEFQLPDTMRIWDSIFAATHRVQFIIFMGCAMLISVRDTLLEGDFAVCLKLLQAFPPSNIDLLLNDAHRMYLHWEASAEEEAAPTSLDVGIQRSSQVKSNYVLSNTITAGTQAVGGLYSKAKNLFSGWGSPAPAPKPTPSKRQSPDRNTITAASRQQRPVHHPERVISPTGVVVTESSLLTNELVIDNHPVIVPAKTGVMFSDNDEE